METRVVQASVTVTDAAGRPVLDLRPEEFLLLENGKPRKITVDTFETGMAPIALVLAVQSSGISVPALEKIAPKGPVRVPWANMRVRAQRAREALELLAAPGATDGWPADGPTGWRAVRAAAEAGGGAR